MKVFLEEQRLREFINAINRSPFKEIMKEALLSEMEREKAHKTLSKMRETYGNTLYQNRLFKT